jgi:DNA-binding XRE family transcriptional regulator
VKRRRPADDVPESTNRLASSSYARRLLTIFSDKLERDRKRWGLTVGQAAWRFGVRPSEYRQLEAGERWPSFETYDRICKFFGWPQTFLAHG